MKKLQIFILLFIFLFSNYANIFIRCNKTLNPSAATDNDRLEKIKEKGVLTIVSANSPPFCYLDPDTGSITGIDGDIITEVAKRLGVNKVEMKITIFDELFTRLLEDDEIDCVVSGAFDTPERRKLVNFTTPWYKSYEIFVVPKLSNIQFKEDLKDKIMGIQAGTVDQPYAEKQKEQGLIKDLVLFPDQITLLNDVNFSKIPVGMSDALTFSYITNKYTRLHLRALIDIPIKGEAAAALRYEDTTLVNAMNEKINDMKRDKTFNKIIKKYGLDEKNIVPPPPYF
ncbi:ABC transporter substrate-binding protein [Clostridium sp. SHJSY1]|uniref:ABC transporter substrate-binding protein n=1 Tax=Clostridium sp. SHJSY1 TaxID=2942483 RepID=UPI002874DADB|nr:ABC transporter substrate-binding protein [Clostridium sp. SHJSY1]MDS0527689.1 ABC transporter substrate-binding protein [Clostridium sp. SHJSY1]